MVCALDLLCELENKSHCSLSICHGIVENEETIIYFIFNLDISAGSRLEASYLDKTKAKPLKKGDFSIARQKFATVEMLLNHVIAPAEGRGNTYVGVVTASVRDLRNIQGQKNESTKWRGLCVLDKADGADHEAHATLGYCCENSSKSQTDLFAMRTYICADLVRKFSAITSLEEVFRLSAANAPSTNAKPGASALN